MSAPKVRRTRETVNHPDHYGGDTPYEAIKVIEAWGLGFHLGNTVKYVRRAGYKGAELEDLHKARWYLDRRITQLEEQASDKEGNDGSGNPESGVSR